MPTVSCISCGTEVSRPPSWLKKNKQNFCCQDCFNAYRKGRKIPASWNKTCKTCDTKILKKYVHCSKCTELGRHKKCGFHIEDQPLQFYIDRSNNQNRYRSIRDHAKRITKNRDKRCAICGYDLHVEVCHIKAIKDFYPESLVREINHPNNLILLCKNHHWELDNGYITLNEPTRTRTWN